MIAALHIASSTKVITLSLSTSLLVESAVKVIAHKFGRVKDELSIVTHHLAKCIVLVPAVTVVTDKSVNVATHATAAFVRVHQIVQLISEAEATTFAVADGPSVHILPN